MLRASHLQGFAKHRYPAPRMRFVNSYTMTYGGTVNGVATIAIADLQYPPSPYRQLVVKLCTEVVSVSKMLVNGVVTPQPVYTVAVFQSSHTANITIGATLTATSTEVGRIIVYETEFCAPLTKSFFCDQFFGGAALTAPYELVMSEGGLALLVTENQTDTATHTINGGLTKDLDIDGGDMRAVSGSLVTPATAVTRITSTVVASAGFSPNFLSPIGIRRLDDKGVGVSPHGFIGGTGIVFGTPQTELASDPGGPDMTGCGTFKIVLMIVMRSAATINSITINGVAFTRISQTRNTNASPALTAEIWVAEVANDVPSGNIVYTFSADPGQYICVQRFHLYDVQSVGTPQTVQGNATGAALAVSVSKGGVILASTIRDNQASTVTWTGVTEKCEFNVTTAPAFTWGGGDRFMCDDEVNRTVQAVGSVSGQYCTMAIAFNP